jgi:hypothetical protein
MIFYGQTPPLQVKPYWQGQFDLQNEEGRGAEGQLTLKFSGIKQIHSFCVWNSFSHLRQLLKLW